MNWLLLPFSFLFGLINELSYFALSLLPKNKFKFKLISIGNLTIGGTGKTPFIHLLCSYLKHKKVAVLSRGYKRKSKGFLKVDNKNKWNLYGDEAFMLSHKNPNVDFYVCDSKLNGLREIEKLNKYDVVLLDDSYHHSHLWKDIEFVIIDSTLKKNDYFYFPFGKSRLSLKFLNPQSVIIYSKLSFKDESFLELKNQLNSFLSFDVDYIKEKLPDNISAAYLISGVGNPRSFQNLVESLGVKVFEHFVFQDHYHYKKTDLDIIKTKVQNGFILTTEKDYYKMKDLNSMPQMIVVRADFKLVSEEEKFKNFLNSKMNEM